MPDVQRNDDVCPKCDHHMRIGARKRLGRFLDEPGGEEILADIESVDRLKFKDKKRYKDRLSAAQKSTGEKDALIAMRGHLHGLRIVALAFEFDFHGGSMGYAVGEKFTRAAQISLEERIPLVCFSASGGARMQEALISLMQMAKTSAVLERLKQAGVPYISVMTDPIYRRSVRFAGPSGGCKCGRARCSGWFCRPQHHRTDDPPETSQGLSAQ